VSDRGLPIADGAHACPFVAFEDDRDERADVPDYRHRCYAESPPAPRAHAHQEAYCLSSAFPVCPTFQEWARREAARTRAAAATGAAGRPSETDHVAGDVAGDVAAGAAAGLAASSPEPEPPASADLDEPAPPAYPPPRRYEDIEVKRNPPRDWSAPPPWLASAEAANASTAAADDSNPPKFLAPRSQPGQGLAGSTADRWAGGSPPPPPAATAGPGSSAAAAAAAAAAGTVAAAHAHDDEYGDPRDAGGRPTAPPPPPRRPRAYDQHLGGPSSGPDWEHPRHYEAYPTIRTRVGLPDVPRLAVMAAAVAIAALALFFLPALLGLGGGQTANSTPSPSPSPSTSVAPTTPPAPTPAVYVIKKGDTLSKIATAHGLTIEQLMAANPTIKDPNKIVEGQQIVIPAPGSGAPAAGGSAAPAASGAP
jgi:hypothetical protein